MANKKVTDLTAITTAPVSGVMHFIDTTDTSQNAAGSSFKVTKADLLKENTAAILLNTAKVGITPTQATAITNNTNKVGYTDALVAAAPTVVLNTAKVGITPTQATAITANTAKVGYTEALVNANVNVTANTSKVGITVGQASAITTNTAKVGYTDALVSAAPAVVANTAKVGISSTQASAIIVNTAKVGYSEALVDANTNVVSNTAKVGITSVQSSAIVSNTAKVGITPTQASAITANTAKTGITTGQATTITTNTSLLNIIINNTVTKYIRDFTSRILADSGAIENVATLTTNLTAIFTSASFNTITGILFPSGTKAGKLYSLLPENGAGDFTVVRNTTATRFNSSLVLVLAAANVARLNYLTVNGDPFILDEQQRTNLALFSQDLTNAVYVKSNVNVTNTSTLTPENNASAQEVEDVTTSSSFSQTLSLPDSVFTVSGFFKRSNTDFQRFLIFDVANSSNGFRGWFNLANGTLGTSANFGTGTLTDFKISSVLPNGWYRVEISGRVGASASVSINALTATADNSTTRIAGGKRFIFGFSVEVGQGATSYIPTTSSAITRNLDLITVTPPVGTVKITTTFSDNTTQVLTTIPATYTMPDGLIKNVNFNNAL